MFTKSTFSLVLFLVLLLFLTSCGGGDQGENLAGDAASRGRSLFDKAVIGPNMAPGCVTCHSLEPGVKLIGPSMAGIATIADSAVPGLTAEQFLREALVDPDAHVQEGFVEGIMFRGYGEDLTEEEINDLIAFLMTLK
jgi:cytochrome c2